jgi:hypothetical protein
VNEILSADRVIDIMKDCLFDDEDLGSDGKTVPNDAVIVEGIVNNYAFNPKRLNDHAKEIGELLLELPDEFLRSKGGGMSFLNACMDRHGNHWAEHRTMEVLFVLGMAVGKVKLCLPRDMWTVLPGGMPYYSVDDVP